METEDSSYEQERKLEEMDYSPSEDIFNREEYLPLDGNGNVITNPAHVNDEMPFGIDIPGAEDDDNFEQIMDHLPDENSDRFGISGQSVDMEDITDNIIF